jgi:hypothetical protein
MTNLEYITWGLVLIALVGAGIIGIATMGARR